MDREALVRASTQRSECCSSCRAPHVVVDILRGDQIPQQLLGARTRRGADVHQKAKRQLPAALANQEVDDRSEGKRPSPHDRDERLSRPRTVPVASEGDGLDVLVAEVAVVARASFEPPARSLRAKAGMAATAGVPSLFDERLERRRRIEALAPPAVDWAASSAEKARRTANPAAPTTLDSFIGNVKKCITAAPRWNWFCRAIMI